MTNEELYKKLNFKLSINTPLLIMFIAIMLLLVVNSVERNSNELKLQIEELQVQIEELKTIIIQNKGK